MRKKRIAPSHSRRSRQTRGRLWLGLAGAALMVIVAGLTWWLNNPTVGEAGVRVALPTPSVFRTQPKMWGRRSGNWPRHLLYRMTPAKW